MGMSGTFREVVMGQRLVSTERFDDPWYEGEAVGTVTFVERGGRTTVTTTVLYQSKQVRDGVLKGPMASGIEKSYDQLAELLSSTLARRDRGSR